MHRERRPDDEDDFYTLGSRAEQRSSYRKPSAAAEALFAAKVSPNQNGDTSEPAAEEPRTGKVKWFNVHQGFGFVIFPDDLEAFLPARHLRGEVVETGATITVRLKSAPKGFEVTEVIGEIGPSTVLVRTGVRTPRRQDPGAAEWTGAGTLLAQDWRNTFGFLRMDDGSRVFVSGSTLGKCGLTAETIVNSKLEVGVARGDRGPAAVTVKVLS